MDNDQIENFIKLQSQLESSYKEISLLSKKKPNDALNKFKLKFINNILTQANKVLGERYKPFDNFDKFDEEDIPSNSDAVFIMAQYLDCFEKLRCDNIARDSIGQYYWKIDDKISDIRTKYPTNQ